MSASAAQSHEAPLPEGEATEYATRGAHARGHRLPHLRIVSPLRPERASRGVFALLVTGLLGVGLLVMLLINTSLAQGAFVVSDLAQQKAQLSEAEAVLSEGVSAAGAPTALETQARALGMIPSQSPAFLSIPDGAILGRPRAARVPSGAAAPVLSTPADATSTEAVDNASVGTDLPISLGAEYDPAAADAAAASGKKPGTKPGKGKPNEASMWTEVPVDTGTVGSGDAGLDAMPIQ